MLKTLKQWLCKHDLTMLVFDLKSMTVRERCRNCGWEKATGDKVSGSFVTAKPIETFKDPFQATYFQKPKKKSKKGPEFSWQEEKALLRMRKAGRPYGFIQNYFKIRFGTKRTVGSLRTKHWKLTNKGQRYD